MTAGGLVDHDLPGLSEAVSRGHTMWRASRTRPST